MDERVLSGAPGVAADCDQRGGPCLPFLVEAVAVHESDQYWIIGWSGHCFPGAGDVVVGASFQADGVRVDRLWPPFPFDVLPGRLFRD